MSAYNIPPAGLYDPHGISELFHAPNIGMKPKAGDGRTFAQVLQETQNDRYGLQFSHHAMQRLENRGINLDDRDLQKLSDAIDRLEKKGGHESLVVMDETAFVVDVDSKTVITALNQMDRQENVFTNIDSAVVVE